MQSDTEYSLLRVMVLLCFIQLILTPVGENIPFRLNLRIFCFIEGTLFIHLAAEPGFTGPETYTKLGEHSFRKIIQLTNMMWVIGP